MPIDGQSEIRALTTRVVYANRWMTVREDGVRRADGSEGIYGVVEKPDFAVIIPLADDGRLRFGAAQGRDRLRRAELSTSGEQPMVFPGVARDRFG